MTEPYEIEYWCKEFPDLDKEDIIALLEAAELDALEEKAELDKSIDDKYNYDTYSK